MQRCLTTPVQNVVTFSISQLRGSSRDREEGKDYLKSEVYELLDKAQRGLLFDHNGITESTEKIIWRLLDYGQNKAKAQHWNTNWII